ncbi:MAG: UDP-2,3-diacylglucosamine pyrophosphatase LpxH [Oleiphilaceae bacterium]
MGTSDCQATYLIDFLNNNRGDNLYLVGDIIDLLAMKKRIQLIVEHDVVVILIFEWIKKGCKVCYIPRNYNAFFGASVFKRLRKWM